MRKILLTAALVAPVLLQQAAAQNRQISGRVTDRSNGQGLPGVTVLVKGTTIGVSTNADGSYTISAPASATTLTFSSIGFVAVERAIGDASTIDIGLGADSKQLGEVVVTGALGIQRQQQQVGYATASLDSKELTQARVTNVANGLAGKVSGLQIQTLNNSVTAAPRVTLRGSRSLTGNNEALIVIDGVISTNDVLGALNPDDVASIDVLKGANAAALYGSQASNGALIITTKKGGTSSQVTFSHTSQFESISFLPKFQEEFGPGSPDWYNNSANAKAGLFFDPNNKVDDYTYQYQGYENQQYGPRFDGSMRPFGQELADGSVQMLSYEARPNEKKDFFNTGYQMQNGVSFSGGDEKNKFFASYQNLHNNGIVPKDKFDRNSFRFNASREMGRLNVGFNMSYSQQVADVTSNLDRNTSVYWNVFNTTVMAPLTSYKDYVNNPFAEPNYGYYNAYYYNPYFILDANRTKDRRNTVQGNIDLSYKLTDWVKVNYRLGTTSIGQTSLTTQNKFSLAPGSPKQIASYPGFVQDLASNFTRINSDLFLSMDKTFGDISVQAILGNNIQQTDSRYNFVSSSALAVPVVGDGFNLANRVGILNGGDARARTRLYAFYADLTVGYKDFLYLHGSLRNDNISVLDPDNRSFYYPGVDASFVFTNAVPALKDVSWLDYGKIRGGISKVSQVNLQGATAFGVYNTGGAYQLASTYGLGAGFPFGNTASYTANGGLVQPGLLPEETRSIEAGVELSFLKRRVAGAVTYYSQRSTNQTVQTSISGAAGYQTLLLNAGEVQNQGVEADLNITPVRLENGFTFTVGGNFNYNNNEVISLPNGLPQLNLTGSGRQSTNADLFAIPGQPFPVLQGTYYQRTADGQVKMQKVADPNDATLVRYAPIIATDTKIFGNTQPKYRYGFNTSLTFKGLTLAGQGELRTGYVVYNTIGENLDFTGSGVRSTQYGRQDFVYPNSAISTDGGVTYVPNTSGLTPGGSEFWANTPNWNTGVAENYVTTGKFFKIREVSLSYALPTTLVSKIGLVKGASVNLFGRNIFTWVPKENIYTDPEFSGTAAGSNAIGINSVLQTPPTKFYGATLNVTL
ncbi:TonB-linked outer membrane protein, SusC/RagA family [Hymenobacter gelipurpurascens]|uniref:TonB-linked outer membrane protein, SusC/RagA family n=1 Tax=Hymenobacter gelipurpurascens TaxID=89968 RepID=A0A212U9E4_9BACT|nr:SusC/RagA family TonB-linked outer membrane protein [Hymenobacter gelipurpurascens]SNC74908.1 TonB-linked outer membrane protein, SusC/RagA family [Hymenobacter gelipurpurascens]